MDVLVSFLVFIAAAAAASLLHEVTHYLVARLCGRRARFVVGEWAVYHEMTEDGVTREDWLIQAAPLVVGVPVGVLLVVLWPVPVWALPAWYLYTLHGAVTNDFRFTTVEEERAEGEA